MTTLAEHIFSPRHIFQEVQLRQEVVMSGPLI